VPAAAARARLRDLLRARLDQRAAQLRAALPAPLPAPAFEPRLAQLEADLRAARLELRPPSGPFHAGMRVAEAWRRHPGARGVFRRHHLPACDRCAVRFDEGLDEAAEAYGLDLRALLAELNALLDPAARGEALPWTSPAAEG
jgi:hypothetical protein